jgi:thioredoxin
LSLRELSGSDWDEVVQTATLPMLVDIWAPWCVPCRKVTPIVEQLAVEFADRLIVATLNGDDAPGLMSRYEVLSLPTLLLVNDGAVVERVVGVPKIDRLRAVIDPYVEHN